MSEKQTSIKFTQNELQILIVAMEGATIKGKDALPIANLIKKLSNGFERATR